MKRHFTIDPNKESFDYPRGKKAGEYRGFKMYVDNIDGELYVYSLPNGYRRKRFENKNQAMDYIDELLDDYDHEYK